MTIEVNIKEKAIDEAYDKLPVDIRDWLRYKWNSTEECPDLPPAREIWSREENRAFLRQSDVGVLAQMSYFISYSHIANIFTVPLEKEHIVDVFLRLNRSPENFAFLMDYMNAQVNEISQDDFFEQMVSADKVCSDTFQFTVTYCHALQRCGPAGVLRWLWLNMPEEFEGGILCENRMKCESSESGEEIKVVYCSRRHLLPPVHHIESDTYVVPMLKCFASHEKMPLKSYRFSVLSRRRTKHLYLSEVKRKTFGDLGLKTGDIIIGDLIGGGNRVDTVESTSFLPEWTRLANEGAHPWVLRVRIVCGGGNQVLSEMVESFIKHNQSVAKVFGS